MKEVMDLILWQRAMDFVETVYRVTQAFPRSEIYGLTKQVRAAAVSIPSNIAEGYEQLTTGNFIRFLGMAKGSLGEAETQLHLAHRLNFLDHESLDRVLCLSSEVGRILNGLIKSLRSKGLLSR